VSDEAQSEPIAPQSYEVIVPEAESAGHYANGFTVWGNITDFTIDFYVWQPLEPRTDDSGNSFFHQPLQVVSRVKLPPALIFRLAQELSTRLAEYEDVNGPVTPLGDPIVPPPDDLIGGGRP
jgi:hypothetical protein